eukprot:6178113-Pleurochrysis_carterae.AAC.1
MSRYTKKLRNEGKRSSGTCIKQPPEEEDKCKGGVARVMTNFSKAESEEDSDTGMDLGGQEGRREMEVIGGPANARRMKHARREGNKPSFWTYLKENGCQGCQKQGEEETIHCVLCGGCEATKRKENSR